MPKKLDEYELLEEFKQNYIECITKFRAENNMSQKDFAEYIGVQQQAISRIENGLIDIRISTLMKILAHTKNKVKIKGVK